ncbi:hypothetical protein HY622_04040 [Candidatus Uhrbacteria bacterium]|nr:hypothetical protein [Candidatus Uhrbacteria bacterium]
MRREYQSKPQDKNESSETQRREPSFKRRVISRISGKESAAEATEYSGGAAGRKEYEGPEGLKKAAREYVLRYAASYLRDYVYSMDEIPDPTRKQTVYESTLKDVSTLLSDENVKDASLEELWGTYQLDINQTVNSSVIRGVLKELIFNLYAEYRGLVGAEYQRKVLLIEGDKLSNIYHAAIEIQPELRDGTFVVGDIRYESGLSRYDKAPVDAVFLKNVFGIEIGSPYPLESFSDKKEDSTSVYEVLIQEARQALYAKIINGEVITEEHAQFQYPSIPIGRLKELITASKASLAEFKAESEQVAAKSLERFKSLLQAMKSDFIGIKYQERGSSKYIDGAFYPDRTGIEMLEPKGNEIYAEAVFGDDMFQITNIDPTRSETERYLGFERYAHEIVSSDPTKIPHFYVFEFRVTKQAYERFCSDVSELWATIYNYDAHQTPTDIAFAVADAEKRVQKNIARDEVVGRIVQQIHIMRDSAKQQQEIYSDDPEIAEVYKDTSRNNLVRYFKNYETAVLARVYIEVWRQNIDPEVTDTLIDVLKSRKLTDDDLQQIFQAAAQSKEEWIGLRRSLWRQTRNDEYLYVTLFDIIESGGDKLGYSTGAVMEYDPYLKERIQKEYEWGIADIETVLDRLVERHSGKSKEPIITNEQAQRAIDTLLANTNNMNPAIVRFLPYVTDQIYLLQLAKQWTADADDERLRDTPPPVDPFSSIPCRILDRANQGVARHIMNDDSFSYETRLYALWMRNSLKPTDRKTVQQLLSESRKTVVRDGETIDIDRERSDVRVYVIDHGLLDPYKDILRHLAAGPHKIDHRVLQAAQHRLKYLDERKSP